MKSNAEYFKLEAHAARLQETASRNAHAQYFAEHYADKAAHMEWAAKAAELLEGGAVKPIDANSFSSEDFLQCTDTEECLEVVHSKRVLEVV